MTTLFPGLVQALQQNVPLTPIYMTTLFPGLIYTSTTHIHDVVMYMGGRGIDQARKEGGHAYGC
jgi:short-subunit dehydrogenase